MAVATQSAACAAAAAAVAWPAAMMSSVISRTVQGVVVKSISSAKGSGSMPTRNFE